MLPDVSPEGVRADPQAARRALYRRLRPFSALPSYEDLRAAIERNRMRGYDALETYICRLELTAQTAQLGDLSGEVPGPHDLVDIWELIRREKRWLDRQAHDSDRLALERAAAVLENGTAGSESTGGSITGARAVESKDTFREAARSFPWAGGTDPGGTLWKAVQLIGRKRLGTAEDPMPPLPAHYKRFDGFVRLVYDLRAGQVGPEGEAG